MTRWAEGMDFYKSTGSLWVFPGSLTTPEGDHTPRRKSTGFHWEGLVCGAFLLDSCNSSSSHCCALFPSGRSQEKRVLCSVLISQRMQCSLVVC